MSDSVGGGPDWCCDIYSLYSTELSTPWQIAPGLDCDTVKSSPEFSFILRIKSKFTA